MGWLRRWRERRAERKRWRERATRAEAGLWLARDAYLRGDDKAARDHIRWGIGLIARQGGPRPVRITWVGCALAIALAGGMAQADMIAEFGDVRIGALARGWELSPDGTTREFWYDPNETRAEAFPAGAVVDLDAAGAVTLGTAVEPWLTVSADGDVWILGWDVPHLLGLRWAHALTHGCSAVDGLDLAALLWDALFHEAARSARAWRYDAP